MPRVPPHRYRLPVRGNRNNRLLITATWCDVEAVRHLDKHHGATTLHPWTRNA
jgi:hypothetical protein